MYRKVGTALLFLLFVLAGCRINTPPEIVSFTAAPTTGYAPLSVQFTVSALDPDGDTLSCTLNFGDGTTPAQFACGSLLTVLHSYDVGSFTATLTVSDGRGGTASAGTQITASAPTPPADACPAPGSLSLALQAPAGDAAPSGMGRFDGVAYVPGELLVLRPDGVTLQSAEVAALEAELGLERLSAPGLDGWIRYRTEAGGEAEAARRILASGLGVYVQPNYRYGPLYTPNDTLFATYQQDQFGLMQITQGWDLLLSGGCRPVVGVIDSGVANDHPDLAAHVIFGYDFSDGDDDPYPAAGDDHGTFVASIVAAETNNAQGMAGSTNNLAYVMPLKVFPNGTSATIADAVDWARQRGAHVLNLSLCLLDSSGTACADMTASPDATIEAALQAAYNQGVVSLAASGNFNDSFVGYPASSQYTIAVGATDNGDPNTSTPPARASFSNYGSDLDVVAPGVNVIGAGIPTINDAEPYLQGDGTSFATPYAAGVAALYISQYYAKNAGLPTPGQVTTCLRSAAQDLDPAGVDVETGAGLVRADRVLDTVTNAYGCY
ncbi:peptidase S8 and S53 subtilisin kexin sedolisin [Oceanithermus profundus DSM 14977]|uniref:Peptidase S8 and S53 subtilisin kexin sedolisin n=1 Tax=Oceanithermus profundus (strain DSM 14977 / NBRC 100410 / VKM B-2274 / 506) TaxID=670487 RepID=E4U4L0_OCEP5|nr:S8 family serine peptidase [Oceanithermus profundus]ADR37003.1 peptidase S8 and S53 subtilisin kexin sedolisin [Oceanithermus profundus DSM 14977]